MMIVFSLLEALSAIKVCKESSHILFCITNLKQKKILSVTDLLPLFLYVQSFREDLNLALWLL